MVKKLTLIDLHFLPYPKNSPPHEKNALDPSLFTDAGAWTRS
jgi:hypothetical protein